MYVDKHYVYGSDICFLRDQRAIIEATLAKESRIVYYINILREYSDIDADRIKNLKSKDPWQLLISTIENLLH